MLVSGEEDPSQDEIEKFLTEMEHVKQLVQTIKANGGLIDPLIVQEGNNIVFEGNSRLAAYRLLARSDPIKWGKVKCMLLPAAIGHGEIFRLLGEYHITGRKDWAPYEQAGYLWRRHTKDNVEAEVMASEMGLSVKLIKHLISVYDFMVKHRENRPARWSYYDEYLKSRFIQKARKDHKGFDQQIVKRVRNKDIARADDVRTKVAKIAKVGGKTLAKYADGSTTTDQAFDRADARGANNALYNRFRKFRVQISDPENVSALLKMETAHLKKCEYELKKIVTSVQKALSKVEKKLEKGN